MKKYILLIILTIIFIFIAYFYFNKFNFNNKINYTTNRISTEIENNNEKNTNIETEIYKFSTKIIDKDSNRDTNIKITCNKINGCIVKSGEEFSFNKIAGNPTPNEGYKKAGIIVNGELEKGYGGGNCQVSTTIYNAVKNIDGIEITERHEHGVELGYIEKGKDSTVAYGTLDFKFKNNTGYDIKLYADSTIDEVTIKVYKNNL